MVEKTNSDVERALEAFGGSGLKYRSFGTFSPKPNPNAGVHVPGSNDDTEGDAFPVAPAPGSVIAGSAPSVMPPSVVPPSVVAPAVAQGGAGQADTLYPLLGAALPEASVVAVPPAGEQMSRRAPSQPRIIPDDVAPPAAPFPTRQGRPATAYVPPTMPAQSVTAAPAVVMPTAPVAPPRTSYVPPPSPAAPYSSSPVTSSPLVPSAPVAPVPVAPPAGYVAPPDPPPPVQRPSIVTPVAERGWVPPPPAPPEPPPPPPPAPPPVVIASAVPAAPAAPVAPPPATPRAFVPSDRAAPASAAAPAEAVPMTSLAAHYGAPDSPHPVADGAGGRPEDRPPPSPEAADRRSLAEMFRVLSAGSSDTSRQPVLPIGRYVDEEPGLFRRL